MQGWPAPVALSSQDNTHDYNRDGMFEFIGAGQVYAKMIETDMVSMMCLVINKPIPPRTQMVIRLVQHPGILYDNPGPIRVYRPGLPVDLPQFRVRSDNGLNLLGGGSLNLVAVEGLGRPLGAGSVLWDATPGEGGVVIRAGTPFAYDLAPTAEQERVLNEIDAQFSRQEQSSRTDATPPVASATPDGSSRGDNGHGLWALAVVFLIATIVAFVVSIRKPYEAQMAKLKAIPFTREEGLSELLALQREYQAGKIDAATYRDERNRILNRLAGSTPSDTPAPR
jgi:hypothetical protein